MKANCTNLGWHWDRKAIAWFLLLAAVAASWPLLAHGEDAAPTVPATAREAVAGGGVTKADSVARALIPKHNLIGILRNGGPVMYPLLACSFVLAIFIFERAYSLRRRRIIPKPFVRKLLHQLREGQLDKEEALEMCEKNNSVVAVVFAAAIRKWGRPAVEVEQAILDAGERAANKLRRYLRVINGVATVSPLLGLLGTVIGIITSFSEIATTDSGSPEALAGGIGEALMATAAGLIVAIPAIIFYMVFLSLADKLVTDIDELGQDVVAAISAEGLAEGSSRSRSKKKAAA